jgi:hypothetical protein
MDDKYLNEVDHEKREGLEQFRTPLGIRYYINR